MKAKKLILALLGMVTALTLSAQTTVKGIVTDESGEPLIGAGVVVEGSTTGTITGIDGDYVLTVPANAVNLVFSFIGLAEKVVPIEGRTEINVVLSADQTFLDEVVVVGYATVKRRDLLGSVSSVGADKLTEQPVNSVSQALSGKMAGVSVVTTEGDPDADIKIRVRGGGSITQDSSPLYIVDGFPVESINDIASSEIASIDVLKDAFSTAIYGSRGANGVVIVTTKNAEKGQKVSVKLNTYYGLKWMANKNAVQPMNVENFVKAQYEKASILGRISNDYEPYFGGWSDIDQYTGMVGNDWITAVFGKTGQTFSADATVSGSGENYNWTIGYAHMGDDAIMVGSNYMRDNINFKGHFKTSKRTSVDANVRYSIVNVRGSGASGLNDSGSSSGNGRLKHAVQYTPIPVATATSDDAEESLYGDNVQPLRSVADNDSKRLRTTLNINGAFSWNIWDKLNLKIEGGLEDWRQTDDHFYGTTTFWSGRKSKVQGTPSNQHKESFRTKYRNTNTLNYDFENVLKNSDHQLTALIGQELTITKSNVLSMMVDGFPTFFNSQLAWNFMSSATGPTVDSVVASNTDLSNVYAPNDALLSFFARVNYDYKHRYSFGATFRADASSKFANPWGFFPSAAISWNISNEEFMSGAHHWLDQLKLRYSFGTAGNNNIPSDQLSKVYASYTNDPHSYSGSYWKPKTTDGKAVMNNPDLKWETTYTHNIGLDFGFFGGKLNGSIEVYQNDTKDLLINFPISGAGYTSQFRNAGSTRNRGAELSLSAPIVISKDFSLNISGNIAYNQNRVTDLAGLPEITDYSGWASSEMSEDYLVQVNQPLGNMYGYKVDGAGYYTLDDFVGYQDGKWVLKEGVPDDSDIIGAEYLMPGALKLANIDGSDDNKVTKADRTIIGNAMPDVTGGFSISGFFKGFDFSANFNYTIGNQIYNANAIEFQSSRNASNLNRNYLNTMNVNNRWTVIDWTTGEMVTDMDQLAVINAGKTSRNPFVKQAVFTNQAVEDGSFLRLQSLTLGYTLPEDLTKKAYIKIVRVYVTGTNLFCLTKYSGYDPEVDTRRATPLTPGVDYSAYPKSIGFVAGLNLTF